MQEVPGHLLILIQPLDDEGLKPPGKGQNSWDAPVDSVASSTHLTHYVLGLLPTWYWGAGFNPSFWTW